MHEEATVYVVDDDPAVLKSLVALVRVVFPRVEGFSSAAEFLAAYHSAQPGCLVLDVAMPEMNGLDLHRKLLHDKVDLPVLFVSGHGNVQMAVGAMQAGAVTFLEKPFREQELWDNIQRALELDSQQRRRKQRRALIEERLARLKPGERDVLDLLLAGHPNREIADRLDLSVRTVEDRRARIMKKMEAESLAELVQLATSH